MLCKYVRIFSGKGKGGVEPCLLSLCLLCLSRVIYEGEGYLENILYFLALAFWVLYFSKNPKCIFTKCIYPKCIFAKCTRLACLLSFASLVLTEKCSFCPLKHRKNCECCPVSQLNVKKTKIVMNSGSQLSELNWLSKNLEIFQKSKNLQKIRKSSKNLKIFQKSENLPKIWKSSKNLKILQKTENSPKIWKFSKNLKIFQSGHVSSSLWSNVSKVTSL